ncbi:hypothetical protein ACF0H5_014058 [Mactra antiquata]
MNLVKVILLSALVVLSCIHLTSSASCFCTNKDEVSLFEDKELTIVATTVSKSKTCFIGTKMDEEDNPIDESSIRIQELSFGRCGDDQQGMHFENVFTNENIFASLASSYIGTYDDFFEIPLKDFNKRFLTEGFLGYGVWSPWSNWGSCNASSCTDTGTTVRYRWCGNNSTTCPGPEKESLECSISCSTGVVVGWSGWMPWTECGSYDCLYELTSRKRLCLADNSSCVGASEIWRLCSQDLCAVDGGWTEWSTWSGCSGQIGVLTRKRSCTNPPPSTNGKECEGHFWSIKKCPDVDGNWAEWSEWYNCTKSDQIAVRTRNRTCTDPPPQNGGDSCFGGASTEVTLCNREAEWGNWQAWQECLPIGGNDGVRFRYRHCHYGISNNYHCEGIDFDRKLCQIHALWNEWGEWSACSVSCESGVLTRSRSCPTKDGLKYCIGEDTDNKTCITNPHCPVDGSYTTWSEWSACPVSCGPGALYRTRYCTNPSPQFGGKNCSHLGTTVEASFCDIACPVDGHWGSWLAWGNCSATCDYGVKVRVRNCDSPPAANGGYPCEGVNTSTENCSLPLCSIDGNWGQWSNWSQCSCDHTHIRHRDCNNPTPQGGGQYCAGKATEKESCLPNPLLACPVNGGWSEWFNWSFRCSVTCDQGVTKRIRQCSNPVPANGGTYCKGSLFEEKPCIESPCPFDGMFATWSRWGGCSVTCGSGTQERNRLCNPPPMYGGANCAGDYQEHKTCVQNPCPIDGHWSDWGSWSNWDKSCSFATRVRSRFCDSPPPQYHGRICMGEFNDTESTDLGNCPVDGNWGQWSDWSACSCHNTRIRHRDCNNPTPVGIGKYCDGNNTNTENCQQSSPQQCPVNGGWSEWLEWSSRCSVTCGQGVTKRFRQCANPIPSHGGEYCKGDLFEERQCIESPCPVDGVWGLWESWTACSVTCEKGTHSRSRICDSPSPQFNGNYCVGNATDVSPCIDRPSCIIDGVWAIWSSWFGCSTTCGYGENTRYRTCSNPRPQNGGKPCPGTFADTTNCRMAECPVDGQWTDWSAWNECSVTCQNGTQARSRNCTAPAPQFGGKDCQGGLHEFRPCAKSPCPIDGMWGAWSQWFECSTTCGPGTITRNRTCDNPQPQYGGSTCPGKFIDTTNCSVVECPVDGQWTDWGAWNECSVTCQNGTQARSRNCTAPAPQFGGKDCQGGLHEFRPCAKSPCPINGEWGEWLEWSSRCSATCGQGVTKRYRLCSNPIPMHGGEYCAGNLFEEKHCSEALCLVDGQWGQWSDWSTCSCHNTRVRHRDCNNPAPVGIGKYCDGNDTDTENCQQSSPQPCPVNGGWSEWLEWSSRCSVTCGQGVTKRFRQCANPIPAHGGEYCKGDLFEERQCIESPCPDW